MIAIWSPADLGREGSKRESYGHPLLFRPHSQHGGVKQGNSLSEELWEGKYTWLSVFMLCVLESEVCRSRSPFQPSLLFSAHKLTHVDHINGAWTL